MSASEYNERGVVKVKEQRLVKITRDSDGYCFTLDLMWEYAGSWMRVEEGMPEHLIDLLLDEAFVYGLEE